MILQLQILETRTDCSQRHRIEIIKDGRGQYSHFRAIRASVILAIQPVPCVLHRVSLLRVFKTQYASVNSGILLLYFLQLNKYEISVTSEDRCDIWLTLTLDVWQDLLCLYCVNCTSAGCPVHSLGFGEQTLGVKGSITCHAFPRRCNTRDLELEQ